MSESIDAHLLELLSWIAGRRRTYGEAMEAWRSNCPRLSVWDDALADGLVRVEEGAKLNECAVVLTERGRTLLSGAGREDTS